MIGTSMRIGFFDSGVGGLLVMNAVRKRMPHYDYLYYGDTKNVPYGDKTREEILLLTEKGVASLFENGASVVIVACNTASVEALPILQAMVHGENYASRRVLGVVIPAVETLVESDLRNILLIGTSRTIHSQKYERELEDRKSEIILRTMATPDLVPLIEAGDIDRAFARVSAYIDPLVGEVDGVLLGCTHYGLLRECIRKRYGNGFRVFSQDEIIPDRLEQYLSRHSDLRDKLTQGSTKEIIWTGKAPEISDELLC